MLLTKDVACNTQHGILKDFDANFIATGEIKVEGEESFSSKVLQINKNEPTEEFAKTVTDNPDKYSDKTVKRAQLAKTLAGLRKKKKGS